MRQEISDVFIQLLILVGYSVITLLTAGLGLMFEYRSYGFLQNGETVLAIWIGGMGLLLLTFSSLVLRDTITTLRNSF